ncbi:HAD-IIB family hydrolase [Solirhodobacter olei]|uniref:HAD-IIB family hydrolase n=1 Tax=Solirhodobacter olei TaxID=2493082 RepID=UPI000FD94D19|nr:HAD-IIB family hydrolase [Solirhodobacter olei]
MSAGPWLLVSDIDDTLTGDAAALGRLCATLARNRDRVRVALNSSRPAGSVDRTLAQAFPAGFAPDAIITAMGTEIRVAGAPLPGWAARFAGWPRAQIAELVTGLGHAPHAAEYQTPTKASFRVPAADLPAVEAALDASGLPHRRIFSGTSDLDLLPPAADKGAAALFLAETLGISPHKLVAAGDSGNDLAMFEAAARAIAVGNAREELLAAMPRGTSFHAQGRHAAGVLEGLIHWGILPPGA